MELQQSRLIQATDPVELAIKFGEAMTELKDNKPTFDKIDECTMLIRYIEVEKEQAQVIQLKSDKPQCKNCPHYQSNEGMRRGDRVKWGYCRLLFDTAVNGDKPICSRRKMEERKEVRIGAGEHEDKTSIAM